MPEEMCSVVVRRKNIADTFKGAVQKVVKQMGSMLGVRVRGVKPIRGGGAAVHTPFFAKFGNVGLDVSIE